MAHSAFSNELAVLCRPFASVLAVLDALRKLFGLSLLNQTSGYVQIYCSYCAIAVLGGCEKYVFSAVMRFGTICCIPVSLLVYQITMLTVDCLLGLKALKALVHQ